MSCASFLPQDHRVGMVYAASIKAPFLSISVSLYIYIYIYSSTHDSMSTDGRDTEFHRYHDQEKNTLLGRLFLRRST